MRWCYKTVHFALKKEGFLGSSFLDEAEVEQALNEYGQSGWELVSIAEAEDGIIAFFKQPLDLEEKNSAPERLLRRETVARERVVEESRKDNIEAAPTAPRKAAAIKPVIGDISAEVTAAEEPEAHVITEEDVITDFQEKRRKKVVKRKETGNDNDDLFTIRIE